MKKNWIAVPLLGVTWVAQAHADPQQPLHTHLLDGMGLLLLVCVAIGAFWLLRKK